MVGRTISGAFLVLLMVGRLPAVDDAPKRPTDVETAAVLFRAGKFKDAETLYRRAAAGKEPDAAVLISLGRIALFSNRLTEARGWLEKALRTAPGSTEAKGLLAEVFYRQDDFAHAAPLLRAAGREARARQLEAFGRTKPYRIDGPEVASLRFTMTDPLPLVRVRVNGGSEVNFLIDTGAAEVVLDTDFARSLGVATAGSETGTFAGGKTADVGRGRVDSLTLGDVVVKNLPVALLPTRPLAPIFGGRRVDGILGTVLFYHFVATLDYPHGRLVLMRDTPARRARLDADTGGRPAAVPFWMAGDHYMVAWARVNGGEPVLLFVDTGLAGGGVTLAPSVIKEAGVRLDEDRAGEGIGGGGRVRVVPFEVRELALDGVTERNVRGLYNDRFPLEYRFGFRMGGIISHGFFRPYALMFDFARMRLLLRKGGLAGPDREPPGAQTIRPGTQP